MSRKEMVKCSGHRWAFVPAHRQALPALPSIQSKGQQLLQKSLFPPTRLLPPISIPLDAKAVAARVG